MIDSQKPGFEELYQAFYDFFQASLLKDASPWNKIRLQMLSQYFDDLSLYKIINPIIVRIQSNPEDRRAIARAALWDASMARLMGQMMAPVSVPYKVISEPQFAPLVQETVTSSSGGVREISIATPKRRRK